ncbi:hypothetical protein ACFQ3S_05785 [Mucilaginibacter terrae]|uniref:hypothetical protein n=1 Tax=Mucilaginibacter terrae TaxID=1955052 RepID=UPI003639BD7F
MKNTLILVSGLIVALYRPSQQNCSIFPSNNKIIDTVVIKATYKNLTRFLPNDPAILYLEKKGHLRSKDVRSTIHFIPDDCNKIYRCTLSDNSQIAKKIIYGDLDQKIIVTCVVFRYKALADVRNPPLIIVTKVRKAE